MRSGLRVAVVGGSIAGCATAVELIAAGHRVSVHERAPGPLTGRGIGVATDPATLGRLADRGLVDRDLPRVDSDVIRYVHRSPGSDGEPGWIGDAVSPASAFLWSALHHDLRRRVPNGASVAGHDVIAGFAGPEIHIEGLADRCDLVVFADGLGSAGRRLVAPQAEVRFRELVVWRGLVPEHEVDVGRLDGAWTRIMYAGGHGVCHLVPGPSGSTAPGDRLVAWGFYLPVPAAELGTVLTDREGRRHRSSVELGRTDDAVTAALRARLAPVIPGFHLDLVDRSRATSLQAVVTVDVDRAHRARACLVGDAATVLPPFSGSGALKAVDDAATLRESLDRAPSVVAALAEWGAHRRRTADTARGIAHRNERELLHRVPDLAAMSSAERSHWLAALHHGDELRLPGTAPVDGGVVTGASGPAGEEPAGCVGPRPAAHTGPTLLTPTA